MSTLAEHRVVITLELDGRTMTLDVNRLDLAMDEEWIPYIQATAVCPLGDGEVATVDPQAYDIWATITVDRLLGRTDRLGDLTRRYRRRKLSALTDQFEGGTLADVTLSNYHDYTRPGLPRRADRRTWRVMVREVEIDRKDATVTIVLASGEARLFDQQHMSTQPDRIPGADLIEKVNHLLAASGFTQGVTYRPASVPADADIRDEALRVPGTNGMESVNTLTRQHNLMAWCDEDGLWHVAESRTRLNVRTLQSAGPDRSVVSEVSKRSRDDGWVTCVLIVYSWEGQERYDYFSPLAPNPERALILRYNRPHPGSFGLARNIFYQVRNRGRALELQAVSEYAGIEPGQQVEYTTPRERVRGRLASIRWQFPGDEMSIRLREVGAA